MHVNSSPPGQNGHHFPVDIFKKHFHERKMLYFDRISLKCPIDNKPALIQVITWRRPGDTPLAEPMLTHFAIYATLGGDELNLSLCINDTGCWYNMFNHSSIFGCIVCNAMLYHKHRQVLLFLLSKEQL